jgi:uncharacterized protein (DUF924 family)
MTTSYRNVFLLACCQALLLTNASGLITMNGLVGFSLAQTKSLATFGATTYVLGSALASMPMSLWMARVVLLAQLARNAFRDTPHACPGAAGALATAEDAIERGFDRSLDLHGRWFLYMPFQHSERLAIQDRAIALYTSLAADGLASPLPWAERHRDVIRRFGRFPHRNAILGRVPTPDEAAFLEQPGSRF